MSIRKWSTLLLEPGTVVDSDTAAFATRTGKLSDFEFTPEPGFLYVTTRAISSRVNANYDGWPPDELRQAYRTFIGRPVYVDHNNWDLRRSRGVIIDAKLYENKLASGHEDVWVQLLIEVDAQAFPKLAEALMPGPDGHADIDSVSMGADVEYTICSVCSNKARDVLSYCAHIPQLKGRQISVLDTKTGSTIKKLCFEDCYGVSFFEISFVFDPADESALISDVMLASASNRSLAHVMGRNESLGSYSQRLGTSMLKVSSIQAPSFCYTCGSERVTFARISAACTDCGTKVADKVLMSLPEQVDTLRDELDCPQCGAEWNGMVCTSCGFELPPEGLGDPDTQPFGMGEGMQEGPPQDEESPNGAPTADSGDEEQEDDDENPRAKADAKHAEGDEDAPPKTKDKDDKSKSKPDSKDEKPPSKSKSKSDDSKSKSDSAKSKGDAKTDKKDDKKSKDEAKKKKSAKEEMSVSRFDDLQKQATLPQDPAYRQDTSPANSVPPYGQAIPGGTPTEGVEPALEPAPAATAVVQDLDAPDISGQVGQSEVTVVSQPAGPTTQPPPGPQVGESLNGAGRAASRAEFFQARANALRERADEFDKRAEVITQTDVRNLDEPPAVNVGADATIDVLKATDEHEQLALADTPDTINDGRETGLPDVRDRLHTQVNPFNDAALQGYSPVNQQVASVEIVAGKCKGGCECPDGSCDCGPCKVSKHHKSSVEEIEATRAVESKAREDQRVNAARTRMHRVANFVDERVEMGLTTASDKFADITRFEDMDDATLDGFVQATREFKAKESKVANRRVVKASSDNGGPSRMPSLGSVSHPVDEEEDPADDYLTFLNVGTN